MDALLNEILNYFGGDTIPMVHANGWKAVIVKIPQFTSKCNFTKKYRGKGHNAIEQILSFLPRREAFDDEDATAAETGASWIIHYLSMRYENQFVSAAIEKGLANDKNKVMSVP